MLDIGHYLEGGHTGLIQSQSTSCHASPDPSRPALSESASSQPSPKIPDLIPPHVSKSTSCRSSPRVLDRFPTPSQSGSQIGGSEPDPDNVSNDFENGMEGDEFENGKSGGDALELEDDDEEITSTKKQKTSNAQMVSSKSKTIIY